MRRSKSMLTCLIIHTEAPTLYVCLFRQREGLPMRIHPMFTLVFCLSVVTRGSAVLGDAVSGDTVQDVVPVPKAHAHNDYYHDRPLLDALDQGFCSVEADVFLVDGKLLVGHSRGELKPERTLEKLYLDPLRERAKKNDGRIHASVPTVTLLIDIKSNGTETYAALHRVLSDYSEMLTKVQDGGQELGGVQIVGAVQVVVSGNRDFETVAKSNPRFVGIDGRLKDLDSDLPGHLMPMISDNWRLHFKWQGKGEMPTEERAKLADIVKRAHSAKRTVRLWATPESEKLWAELDKAGVDHINTDKLERLSEFLRESNGK